MINPWRHILAGVAGVLLCGAPSLQAVAEHGRGDGKAWEARREERFQEMEAALGLSAEQKASLREHRRKHRERAKSLWEEKRGRREALREELEKPSVDEAKVTALHAELKGID